MKKGPLKRNTEEIIKKVCDASYEPNFPDKLLEKMSDEFKGYMHNRPIGSGLYYSFLKEYISEIKPKVIVELGNREGLGICSMYAGLSEPWQTLYTIDNIRNLRCVPDFIINDERIVIIDGDVCAHEIYSKFENIAIDLLFCDTIHTEEQLEAEWNLYSKYLSNSSIVLVDDINLNNKMLAFNKIPHHKFNEPLLHSSGYGIIIVEK